LRKGIKIKALAIFLVWLVIFAHNIIPHNHLLENSDGCHELVHEITADYDDCDISCQFETQPGEVNVCHFSNFLFNQFNQDNIIISTPRDTHYYPIKITEAVLVQKTEPFSSEPYHGSYSLRAPPSA